LATVRNAGRRMREAIIAWKGTRAVWIGGIDCDVGVGGRARSWCLAVV
jgi:hypothetical protein